MLHDQHNIPNIPNSKKKLDPHKALFPLYDVETAKKTILHRPPVGQTAISPSLAASIKQVHGEDLSPEAVTKRILDDVRENGDASIRKWTKQIDGVDLADFSVSATDIDEAYNSLDDELRTALHLSAERIQAFHQKQPNNSWQDWSSQQSMMGQIIRPLARVGVYAPGGTAFYPSTLLMCAVTARTAGVKEVIVTTPADKNGQVHPTLLAAAKIAQVDAVYAIGGAQAIGAMAYGTETINKVDKIVGPGNIFVISAKQLVYGQVDIDGLPGPTETLIIADGSSDVTLVAADLLAQAEHDTQSAAILITPDRTLVEVVQFEILEQIGNLSRAKIITESLQNRGGVVLCESIQEAIELSNLYAPEHLCLHVENPWRWFHLVENAGGIFLGENSYEVLGDYVAGPAHVMPTMGTARFSSPLNIRDFTKIINVFGLSEAESLAIAPSAKLLAEAEGLTAHAAAVDIRLHLKFMSPRP